MDDSPLIARDGGKDVGFGSQSSIDTVQPATIMLSTPPDAGIITVTVIKIQESIASIGHQIHTVPQPVYWY